MTITTLPPELLLHIFSHLSYRDLVWCARRTCRQWRDLSMDEGLMHSIKERDFREDMTLELSGKRFGSVPDVAPSEKSTCFSFWPKFPEL